jgi:hypothetical protein
MNIHQPAPEAKARTSDLPVSNTFTRTLTARVMASVLRRSVSSIAADMWPRDRVLAEMLERAVSNPATTFTPGWAAELAQRKIIDTLDAMYQYSFAADLFAQGTVLQFDGTGAISVPGFAASFGNKGFVAENQPIPVHQLALTIPDQLKPTKCAGIVVLTNEMIESSNAEAMITDAALRMLGRMLDEVIVDGNPADPARPRGLRQGVSAISPVNTAGDTWGNALGDMAALADAVAPVSGNGPLVYIGSVGRALKARVYLQGDEMATALGSGAVINDFLCVATAALVAAIGDPEVESSTAATVHMDDTPNIDVSAAGRSASMFQTNSIALKLRWPVSWAVRDPRGFAWLTPTGW